MTPDFSYITAADGFTSIIPNTRDAEASYNQMFGRGAYRLMPNELAAFKTQAKAAGYTVRVCPKISKRDVAELDLLLEAFNS